MKSIKQLSKIAAVVAATILVTSCGGGSKSAENTPVVAQKQRVKVAISDSMEVAQRANFTGSIEAFTTNHIAPSLGVRINEVRVDVGDKVRRGQILVKMDDSQYLQSLEQLENLKVDLERMRKLYADGGISKQQLDQLETQVKVTQHVTDNLRENTVLTSPISGIITDKLVETGDMYMPTSGKILTVMQMDKLTVTASLQSRYYPEVKNGMTADITLDIFPGRVFKGKVTKRYPSIDPETRSFKIEITVPNAKLELRPGMMCRVDMAFGSENRVLVPDIAVLKQSGSSQRYLFVVDPVSNVVEHRELEIGQVVGNKYEIISGVHAGEQIVVAGMQKLIHGDKVEVVE